MGDDSNQEPSQEDDLESRVTEVEGRIDEIEESAGEIGDEFHKAAISKTDPEVKEMAEQENSILDYILIWRWF